MRCARRFVLVLKIAFSCCLLVAQHADARENSQAVDVATAERRLRDAPNESVRMLDLAQALLGRARVGGKPEDSDRADALVRRALAIAPSVARALTLQAWCGMVAHRFPEAHASVEQARARGADDALTVALQTDALTELGRYAEAESAAQELLDRHYGLGAMTRAAHLRFLIGDADGAFELATRALKLSREAADRAWSLLHLAQLSWYAGRLEDTTASARAALEAGPAAGAALQAQAQAWLGRVEEARGNLDAARARYVQALELFPAVDHHIALWRLAERSGDARESRRRTALLDGMARLDEAKGGLDRRSFALWFAQRDGYAERALRLARTEYQRRPDIYSADALAWALFRAGRPGEALPLALEAVRLGTPDPQLLVHAATILQATGETRRAAELIARARTLNLAAAEAAR